MGRRAIPIEPYIDKLVQAVLLGATYEMAALYAGISYKTFERWRLKLMRPRRAALSPSCACASLKPKAGRP